MGVHCIGFYARSTNPLSNRRIEDDSLLGLIKESFQASDCIYGSPHVFWDLREFGETCGVYCLARIMYENKFIAEHVYKAYRQRYSISSQPQINYTVICHARAR
jgi:putative transposase